jgi:hypothetical protein
MGLAAAWRRQGARAAAVTLLVPAALTIAVLTALLGGGFRGLGALGQVLTGPQVPEARLAASALPTRHHAARLPAVPVLRPVPGGFAGPSAGRTGAPAPALRGTPGAPPVATVPPRRTGRAPGAAGSTPPAAPGPRPAPSPIRAAGEQVAHEVGTLPAVGPAGESAVTTVLDVVEPPPPAVTRALLQRVLP